MAFDEHPSPGGAGDGAAAVLLATPSAVSDGAEPLARVAGTARVGHDDLAVVLDDLGWSWENVDLVELHEPSPAAAAGWLTALTRAAGRINVDGGSLAIGDPVGATGARLVVSLADLLRRRAAGRGLAVLPDGECLRTSSPSRRRLGQRVGRLQLDPAQCGEDEAPAGGCRALRRSSCSRKAKPAPEIVSAVSSTAMRAARASRTAPTIAAKGSSVPAVPTLSASAQS